MWFIVCCVVFISLMRFLLVWIGMLMWMSRDCGFFLVGVCGVVIMSGYVMSFWCIGCNLSLVCCCWIVGFEMVICILFLCFFMILNGWCFFWVLIFVWMWFGIGGSGWLDFISGWILGCGLLSWMCSGSVGIRGFVRVMILE